MLVGKQADCSSSLIKSKLFRSKTNTYNLGTLISQSKLKLQAANCWEVPWAREITNQIRSLVLFMIICMFLLPASLTGNEGILRNTIWTRMPFVMI